MSQRILLAVLPLVAVLVQCGSDGAPTRPVGGVIEIAAAEFKFSPARIALGLGEQARVQITSEDETYTFTIDELGVDEGCWLGRWWW